MQTMILIGRFEEPVEGEIVDIIRIDEVEATAIEAAIAWLNEKGGRNSGDTLPAWTLHGLSPDNPQPAGDGLFVGLPEVMEELILQSRYCETETRGEYYGDQYAPFDAHLDGR